MEHLFFFEKKEKKEDIWSTTFLLWDFSIIERRPYTYTIKQKEKTRKRTTFESNQDNCRLNKFITKSPLFPSPILNKKSLLRSVCFGVKIFIKKKKKKLADFCCLFATLKIVPKTIFSV